MANGLRLDDLYKMTAHIYSEQNAQRSAPTIFTHFVEVCGMLTIHDRKKKREGVTVVDALCKALGWYFPLLAKLRVRSVEEIIYRKYPYACPYCRLEPHQDARCKVVRGTDLTVNHVALKDVYQSNASRRPVGLNQWQKMFQDIYPRDAEDRGRSSIGLFEEVGELAEAIRVFERHPEYCAGEAADTFSYLMGIANEVEIRLAQEDDKLFSFEAEFLRRYPGLCPQCGSQVCVCPSLPQATIGRMAKELPLSALSDLFNPEPETFANDGKTVASLVLDRAGGYTGLAANFPFDRGDANRALVMLCIRLGDVVVDSHPDLARKFHSAAVAIGESAAAPGTRSTAIDVSKVLELVRTTWRELDTHVKQQLESQRHNLALEIGSVIGKVRILFIACSPSDAIRVRGDRELRIIREAIKLAGRMADTDVTVLTAATPDDMRRALLSGEFEIIHFSGHSDGNSLVFEDESGVSKEVPLTAVAELISNYPSVRCVILNSCESATNLTEPISPCTIGMDESIDDEAAIEFARGFYDAIAGGREVLFAAKEGIRCARLKSLEVPVAIIEGRL